VTGVNINNKMSFFRELFSHEDSRKAHEDVYGEQSSHKSSWTHELIGGAAGFAGKIYFIFTSRINKFEYQ
jgi:hypothetical protein